MRQVAAAVRKVMQAATDDRFAAADARAAAE
jgi:hypothetical protein